MVPFLQTRIDLVFFSFQNKQKGTEISSPLLRPNDETPGHHCIVFIALGRLGRSGTTRQMSALIIQEAEYQNKLCTGFFHCARCGRRLFRTDI